MGVDMWAAELLLRMKEQQAYQDVELCLALPFEGYNADWDDWHRKRMDFIRRYRAFVTVKLGYCFSTTFGYGYFLSNVMPSVAATSVPTIPASST